MALAENIAIPEIPQGINVGVIVFCKSKGFLDIRIEAASPKLAAFVNSEELADILSHLDSYKRIAMGQEDAGAIGKLEPAERFRWLTATRSTVVQSSKVHSGICDDETTVLDRLFKQMVG